MSRRGVTRGVAIAGCCSAWRSARRRRRALASMSRRRSAISAAWIRTSWRASRRSAARSIAWRTDTWAAARIDRAAAVLSRETEEDRADRVEPLQDLLIDRTEIAERACHIETRPRLLRRAERDRIQRRLVALPRIRAFGDVQRDRRRTPPKLPSQIRITPPNLLHHRL